MYIYERTNWPEFQWDEKKLAPIIANIRYQQGRLLGKMEAQGFKLRSEANLITLTSDVVKSSAIEGQILDPQQVRSSIALKLGIDIGGAAPVSRDVEGIVEMMLDATGKYNEPLSVERLFGWHSALFPTGRSGMRKITVGAWRSSTMQVVSGPIGREKTHFEAPPADQIKTEMKIFLKWFNTSADDDLILKAGLAHFWFLTIHPFEDGNGRIARAIADMVLTRADNISERFYSMSAQIETERKHYYKILENSQKGDLDITIWLQWFLECLGRAIDGSQETLAGVLRKARIWNKINQFPVNDRQRKIINKLLDGFEGNLSTSKYAKLAKCSNDTALRDIHELLDKNILIQNPGQGRSTSYRLVET